jgi:hypothetical protein
MFIRQRLREGELPHAVHLPQPMDVKGHPVVWHQASICCLVWRYDAVIRRVDTRCQVRRFAVPHV